MPLRKDKPIYFMGIGGTGMASAAGIALEAGFSVAGSDSNLYPPMSTMLEDLKIDVLTPYDPKNIDHVQPQLIVIANALSRGHEELEAALAKDIPYTSFPAFLGEHILKQRQTIVVSGTHGKTTTTSLLASSLTNLGVDPGFLIGGIPRDFSRSFHIGKGETFVIEGDEYDTAFFDKNSKFLHYRPKYLILNNLEFDHADIFQDLEAIKVQFRNLIKLVENPEKICANTDDENIRELLAEAGLLKKVTRVATKGQDPDSQIRLIEAGPAANKNSFRQKWKVKIATPSDLWGDIEFETQLTGHHNAANLCQVIACLGNLYKENLIPHKICSTDIKQAIERFSGVARRMDHIGSANGIDVYEDFAHHPTAVKEVLTGMRKTIASGRILVAFEPKNASSRRNVFLDAFAEALSLADQVFVAPCPVDTRIPEHMRMNTDTLVHKIGDKASSFDQFDQLLDQLAQSARSGDTIIFMSSGSFAGIQHQIIKKITSLA